MSSKRLFGVAPNKVDVWHEDVDGDCFIESRYELDPILEQSKLERDIGQDRKATYRKIGNIPEHVLDQAFREGWFHDPKAWKKWLNDPANKAFRVYEGSY